jgi:3-mercaptopyruvate sulfurtransferase SseA
MEFAEVKQGLEANAIVLIDVRNADEIRNSGKIPGSHNIPCKLTTEASLYNMSSSLGANLALRGEV